MAASHQAPVPVDLAPALEERLRRLLAEVELASVPDDAMLVGSGGGTHPSTHRRERPRWSGTAWLPGRTSRRRLRPVPVRRLEAGTVVIADVPFDDVRGSKTRPAVVVRARRRSIDVLPMSTRPGMARRWGRTPVVDLAPTGLDRRSWVVLRKVTLGRASIRAISGALGDHDLRRIEIGTGLRLLDLRRGEQPPHCPPYPEPCVR